MRPYQWMAAVRDSDLDAATKYQAYTFGTYTNTNTAAAYPSRATLARTSGKSVTTVDRAHVFLRALGWMVRVEEGGGRGRANAYAIRRGDRSRRWRYCRVKRAVPAQPFIGLRRSY